MKFVWYKLRLLPGWILFRKIVTFIYLFIYLFIYYHEQIQLQLCSFSFTLTFYKRNLYL